MPSFQKTQSLAEFQNFISEVYGLPDDRMYSISDLLIQQQRFAMRALKGIRKGDEAKLKINLLISLCWLMAIANRLHIEAEEEAWKRFPNLCSYCGEAPCACKKIKPEKRKVIIPDQSQKPKTLGDFQKMFARIYPPDGRTLYEGGVHLAEETGEISEAIHNYLGKHEKGLFDEIKLEIADFMSCAMGVANSAKFDIAEELAIMFYKNCHVCHDAPCSCGFVKVASLET